MGRSKKSKVVPSEESRICSNIRSKRLSTAKCTFLATNGDFCTRHSKHPIRWSPTAAPSSPILRGQIGSIQILQRFWRQRVAPHLRRLHGPSTFSLAASANQQDIVTLDPLSTIPFFYRISYLDEQRLCWTFDARFLVQTMLDPSSPPPIKNPFTQSPLPPSMLDRLQTLLGWLKKRNYPSVYVSRDTLTAEQRWNQKVLEVFLRYHSIGYAIQPGWFESMTEDNHRIFYRILWNAWNQGSLPIKESIIPDWNSTSIPLFRWRPDRLSSQTPSLKWWKKTSLTLFDRFVSKGVDASVRISGALYILGAFARIEPRVGEAFPFLGS
jgi:hypothetical protein